MSEEPKSVAYRATAFTADGAERHVLSHVTKVDPDVPHEVTFDRARLSISTTSLRLQTIEGPPVNPLRRIGALFAEPRLNTDALGQVLANRPKLVFRDSIIAIVRD